MLKIDPELPMLKMLPTLPMLKIDPALPMLRTEQALRILPMLKKLMMLCEPPLLRKFAPALRTACLPALFRYAFLPTMSPRARLLQAV
jgi:hypothetical protein